MLLSNERHIVAGIKPRRTSKPDICPDGFSEPTATIVWGALLKIGVLPGESLVECLSLAFIRSAPRLFEQSYA